ncbi:hypothetical protein COS51_01000 [Candidatus Roizmanbacteria bacterium CG03_land_8_20_14_0_80_36_21]|nr:MAG: hypothetical protein COS51_01000 [Candidatus Roizmanbacteria bacterium CG03_land_8_20_14_0_80_36_21]
MKIGLDISQIVHKGTGVARFTEGLVNAILDYDNKNHWSFLFYSLRRNLDRNIEEKITKKGHQLIKWKLPPTLVSLLWNRCHQFKILNLKFKINLDWFISSDWIEPPTQGIKKATIVHDLVFLRHPETVNKKILFNQTQRLYWVKKESNLIFADSQTTKSDLINLLNIPEEKIQVNYPGVEVTKPTQAVIEETLAKFDLKKPFILTVGKIEPRKNLKRLIKAMKQWNNEAIKLVIVGPRGWEQFGNKTMEQYNNVKFLGYIDDVDLYSLYSSCLFFINPSIWEGFGYPLIEAMSLKTPIACSNIKPFVEIVKNAAIFFDPLKTDDIADKINKITVDTTLRKKLIENGKIRAKEFNWKNYYNKLVETLNSNI